ncbi:cation efflux system protein [Pilimelia terevasa]|uniref:Cation efflux system protein n=1 Tax=Pilimelia terevasa TaxID=53372 RepID=A0A8J3BKB7_9ACTN|nr:cation diffusion facilitator family transporter [Pilimelia terevasa]GGK28534.1 cation efflux system protein [Pilimelia terevasa]
MGAGHDHGADALRTGQQHLGRLIAAIAMLAALTVAEVVIAYSSGSLALLSEAGHLFTDVLGMCMALAALIAVRQSGKHERANPQRTFGLYRLEVLTALANAVLLSGVAVFVMVKAAQRLTAPPEIEAGPVMIVAGAAVLVNVVAFLLLQAGAKENLNLHGAALEVLSDLFGAAGVLAAGTVIHFTGWHYADPIAALAVGVFILPRTFKLARKAVRILIQTAPHHIDVVDVERALRAVRGVADVHDLHVWTLASGMDVASAHLLLESDADVAPVLHEAQEMLHDKFHITHPTLQVEPARSHPVCHAPSW